MKAAGFNRAAGASAALIILVANLGGWYLVRKATSDLGQEFGHRLVSVGRAVSAGLDPDRIDNLRPGSAARELVAGQLEHVRDQIKLSKLFLFDRNLSVVAGGGPERPFERAGYLELYPDLLAAAWGGEASSSPVRYVEGVPFMDALAPVLGLDGEVRFLLAVEDSPRRLQVFRGSYVTLAIVGFLSTLIVVGLVVAQAKVLGRLDEARGRMADADRLKALGQLGATVAHEIRNPLTSLSASAQVVLRRWRTSSRVDEEILEDLPKEVERINRIITDFLAFSRETPLEASVASPRAFVERGVRTAAPDGAVAGVSVRLLDDAGSPAEASFDTAKLQQVLQNLLLNAAHATEGGEGGEGREVRVASGGGGRGASGRWWFEVCDDGPGVPTDLRPRVFEPYFTSKAQGTGLGLAVSRQVVQAHGGEIECGDDEGGGARFRVTLPAFVRSPDDRRSG